MRDDQATGHHTRPENQQRRQNDFPGVHQTSSVVSSVTTSAFSKCSRKSSVVVFGGFCVKVQMPSSNMTAAHGATARHKARAHNASGSSAGFPRSNAVMRFSNA